MEAKYKIIDATHTVGCRITSFAVLFDPSIEDVIGLAESIDEAFIYTFLVDVAPADVDWSVLPKSNWIVRPIDLSYIQPKKPEIIYAAAMRIVNGDMTPNT